MSIDGFEDWDEDFLDQLVQAEELALSSTNPAQLRHHQNHPPPPPPRLPAPFSDISYSPPRELSQRVTENPRVFKPSNGAGHSHGGTVAVVQNEKEQETDKLKKELGRVSQQLTLLEQECLELRKERDNKEEQLRSVLSGFEAKHNEARSTKSRNLAGDNEGHIHYNHRVANKNSPNDQVSAQINVEASVCKAIGVQTDNTSEAISLNYKDDSSTRQHHYSKKLIGVWDPPTSSRSGRNLVSNLFVACETDLLHLFGCLSSNLPSKTTVDKHSAQSAEAAKVSYLHSMLTKINNDMVTLEALLEALVDLCRLENVAIVYRSLRVLSMVLNNCFSIERKSDRRNNVTVELLPPSLNDNADVYGSGSSSEIQMRSFDAEFVFNNKISLDWVSLFQLMHQISMKNNEEHVRMEALSIMNMILMRTNAYSERDKFGHLIMFESFSQLLRKEAGLGVQNQAVRLLYLLLNCPKFLAILCCGGKEEGGNAGATNSDSTNASVFECLADCLACNDNCKQGLKLRRKAINLLAFLASSGKSGFEILLGHGFSKRTHFLALILQVLISETDLEASELVHPSEIFKERTLLMREALILMNRLVSNPQYSGPVLRVLTNTREVASLTVDVASRLSRSKVKWLCQSDTMTRQIRETEIVELGRVFRKRVFTFLGDNIS